MIQITALEKRFGPRRVLCGLDARIEEGRVTALVGPNGAGKTTLIKCILGLTRPDAGDIVVDGRRLNGDPAYRRHIGYMPQYAAYPENLTVREVLALVRDLRGNPGGLDEDLPAGFGLGPEMDKPLRALSGGTRQKVSAVIAFLFRPRYLILDEPTAGLDPVASSVLKDKILKARDEDRTVILTSHIMSEVEELSDQLIFLLDGQVWFEGETAQIKQQTGEARLERALARILHEQRPLNGFSRQEQAAPHLRGGGVSALPGGAAQIGSGEWR